jgi:WD40 repeat protein
MLLTATSDKSTAPPQETVAEVHAWNLQRGERQFVFQTHAPTFDWSQHGLLVGLSPDGRFALSAGIHHQLRASIVRWDLVEGSSTVLGPSVAYPQSIVFAPDGQRAAISGGTDEVVLVDLPQGTLVRSERAAENRIPGNNQRTAFLFSQDGLSLLQNLVGGEMLRRDARTLEIRERFAGLPVASADGSRLLTITDGRPSLRDGNTSQILRSFELADEAIGDTNGGVIAISPSGSLIVVQVSRNMFVFDTATGKRVARFEGFWSPAEWSEAGAALIVDEKIWDTRRWTSLPWPKEVHLRGGRGHFAEYLDDTQLIELDALTLRPTGVKYDLRGHPPYLKTGEHYAFTEDRAFVAYADNDEPTIRVLRMADRAVLDIGIARIDGASYGFVSTPQGGFDGPEAAAGCAPKRALGRRMVPGLMQRFFAGKPID